MRMSGLVGRSYCLVAAALIIFTAVDPSGGQGNRNLIQPFRGPLVNARGQSSESVGSRQQQVILPRGFQQQSQQQDEFQRSFPSSSSSLGTTYETRGNSRVIPSIQNGHFHLRSPGGSFENSGNTGGFSPLLRLPAARPPLSSAAAGSSSSNSESRQITLNGGSSPNGDPRYEYYDDGDDIIYHYSNEEAPLDSASAGLSSSARGVSPSAGSSSSRLATGGTSSVGAANGRRVSGSVSTGPQQPSSFIPLGDEEDLRGVGLKGRSVHAQPSEKNFPIPPYQQQQQHHHHPNPTPLPALLRNSSIYNSNLLLNRNRNIPPPSAPITKRPPILRGPVNRFTISARPSASPPVVPSPDRSAKNTGSTARLTDPVKKSLSSQPHQLEYEEYNDEEEYYEDEEEEEEPENVSVGQPPKNDTKTKVTVSISTQTSSTTPRPTPTASPEIVISVATTRSMSDTKSGSKSGLLPPQTTPKVTFSRATGSSIVVASVQTSRSISGAPPTTTQRQISSQQPPLFSTKANPVRENQKPSDPSSKISSSEIKKGGGVRNIVGTTSKQSVIDEQLEMDPNELASQLGTSSIPPPPPASTAEPAKFEISKKLDEDPPKVVLPESLFKSIKFEENLAHLLPPGYTPPPPESTSTAGTTTTTTTSKSTTGAGNLNPTESSPVIVSEDSGLGNLAGLLPPGFKLVVGDLKNTTTPPSSTVATTSGSGIESLFSKVKFSDISALLPPGYDPSRFASSSATTDSPTSTATTTTTTTTTTTEPTTSTTTSGTTAKAAGIEALIPNIKFDEISKFLPPGFLESTSAAPAQDPPSVSTPESSTSGSSSTTEAASTTSKSLNKLVFPTRPGGLKATRPTVTERPVPDTPPPLKVTIMKGLPTRKTTEFTGWPTSSTTPTPSTSSTTTTEAPTTTTTTTTTPKPTTTTLPPKRSAVSSCGNPLCKMEAVLRIVGYRWKPEYADINTDEWKHLERTVKRELDAAYRSSGLAQYYRSVEIEGFTRGSVIVDYFVLLENVTTNLTSADVRAMFHGSLPPSDQQDLDAENVDSDNKVLPADERLRLGRYTIDPKYTDFKVRNTTTEVYGASSSEGIIPQWGIAVIVIGLASLMFVVIFGVTVLVNKHKNSKKKNAVSLTQEMLSEFNKSHTNYGVDNYGADDLYNMDDVWNDKGGGGGGTQMDRTFDRKPGKRSTSSGKGSANYNIYDSWKTEWNGQQYYNNGNYYGDSGYAPSRRRSDYDTNF